MLGYVTGAERGQADLVLAEVAAELRRVGLSVAGVVQVNEEFDPARPCHMDLHVLTGAEVIRISQNLGSMASGCRLDPAGLMQAVGLVERALELGPDLLIVNKFGRQEAEGRGFRPAIGQALATGIPVLTAVNNSYQAAFDEFAEGFGLTLTCSRDAILQFCMSQAKGLK
jgi:nucleoside-triphosphatase THEP1